MHRILLLGAGKIGRMIAKFLTSTPDYRVVVADDNRESLALVAAQSGVRDRLHRCWQSGGVVPVVPGAAGGDFGPQLSLQSAGRSGGFGGRRQLFRSDRRHRHHPGGSRNRPAGAAGADFHAAVRAGAGFRVDRGQSSDPLLRPIGQRLHARWRAAAISDQCPALQPDLEHRRPDQRILQLLRGDSRGPPARSAAARRARTFLARRRALRGVQHLRRIGHAVRNAGRPGAHAQLQNRPLQRPPRLDAVS